MRLANMGRELKTARILLGTLKWTMPAANDNGGLVADDIEASVDKHPNNVAIRFEDAFLTYREFDNRANRYAHWARNLGLERGDVVALVMGNEPDYLACWYGLSKAGVVTALINSNLTGASLAHCVRICGAKTMIVGAEQSNQVFASLVDLDEGLDIWSLGDTHFHDLSGALAAMPESRPAKALRGGTKSSDTCLYIYTSGTTGMPKAAKMSHMRVRYFMRSFISVCGMNARDRIYITLPLYHSTGGLCAVGCALLTGAGMILRRKFSAAAFWEDCFRHEATVFVYVGELCRYLLNQPEHPLEKQHSLRTAFGNGLRRDVWEAFSERFGLHDIKEFYGCTEGNVGLINFDGKVGAVGRVPPWLKAPFKNILIIRIDPETGEPVRDAEGRCIEAADDEPGELLGMIGEKARNRYEGYDSPEATSAKVLKDVVEAGDAWFRTGDLMRRDAEGYFYFVDRMGDTFRWKGENVSTGEVASHLGQFPGVGHVNVYGVEVPGHEGRAGMAAITPNGPVDFDGLAAWLDERLPRYAQPVFLRVQEAPDTTSTLKLLKNALVEEGFDPERVADPVWFRHPGRNTYIPLTPDQYETLISGGFRL